MKRQTARWVFNLVSSVFLLVACSATEGSDSELAADLDQELGERCTLSGKGCPATNKQGQAQYCKFRACGKLGDGICQVKPTTCPKISDPVCGCNGVTYINACAAAASGMSVKWEGSCKS